MADSTQPKGATKYLETAFGILPRSKIIPLEAEGVKKILQYIIKLSEQKAPITPDFICDVHRIGFGFIFPDWAGKFRTIDVIVGDYKPPHYSRVPELIKTLCDDLKERLKYLPAPEAPEVEEEFLAEAISLLAWFQHRFVWIHPFKDYNGRVGRLLTNLILLNLGLPILEIKAETGKDREQYMEAMKEADKHNLSRLESLIAKALQESLEKA